MAFAASNHTVLVSDGGLATELEARGHDLSDDLWSARLLFDAPDEIVAAHSAFYRAGAAIAKRRGNWRDRACAPGAVGRARPGAARRAPRCAAS